MFVTVVLCRLYLIQFGQRFIVSFCLEQLVKCIVYYNISANAVQFSFLVVLSVILE